MEVKHLVAYGTLMLGETNNKHLQRFGLQKAGNVIFDGLLVNLGRHPGAILGPFGRICGEVWGELTPEALRHLDRLEGYYGDDPGQSYFVRKTLRLDSGFTAYVYEWNGAIKSGNWRIK